MLGWQGLKLSACTESGALSGQCVEVGWELVREWTPDDDAAALSVVYARPDGTQRSLALFTPYVSVHQAGVWSGQWDLCVSRLLVKVIGLDSRGYIYQKKNKLQ